MGWSFTPGASKADVIREITTNFGEPGIICLKKRVVGNVLWTLFETDRADAAPERWIGCHLIEYSKWDRGYGYKGMAEDMGPYYYSCPLEYLALAPEKSATWRAGVRAYHESRTRVIAVGDVVTLTGCQVKSVTVTAIKPRGGALLGRAANGTVYRIPRRLLAARTEVEA
jgi:hypothetical protein